MLLPSPLATPRELPGACALAENADNTTKPIINIKTNNFFARMNELLSFLITIPLCGYEDL
jgi:hypothetical protein